MLLCIYTLSFNIMHFFKYNLKMEDRDSVENNEARSNQQENNEPEFVRPVPPTYLLFLVQSA